MSRLLYNVIVLGLVVKVFFATLVSFSSDVHEWLHTGEQLCWHEEHGDEASQHSNHHGEPEEHQHGLLTLFAEGQMGEMDSTGTESKGHSLQPVKAQAYHNRLPVAELFAPTASRAPPAVV